MSLIIPVYNGSKHIENTLETLLASLDSIQHDCEIILVNDGSRDGTLEKLKQQKQARETEHAEIRILSFTRNRGQQAALYSALPYCRGDLIITMDDDLQHPPETIPRLLEAAEGYDLVYAVPEDTSADTQRPPLRNLGTSAFRLLLSLIIRKPRTVKTGSYRIFRQKLAEKIQNIEPPFPYLSALLYRTHPDIRSRHITYKPQQRPINGHLAPGMTVTRFSLAGLFRITLKLFLYFGPPRHLMPRKTAVDTYIHDEVFL